MNEVDRAACHEANEELNQLPVTEGFDYDELEIRFVGDRAAGAKYLADASSLSEAEALHLLNRIYRM